jgi:hypothetical protein
MHDSKRVTMPEHIHHSSYHTLGLGFRVTSSHFDSVKQFAPFTQFHDQMHELHAKRKGESGPGTNGRGREKVLHGEKDREGKIRAGVRTWVEKWKGD